MYLSRLKLNLRSSDVQRDLADCQNLHRTVMSGFPEYDGNGGARAEFGVLYRIENPYDSCVDVLVQSRITPAWEKVSEATAGYLAAEPEVKEVEGNYAAITAGQVFSFRLRANVTRKIKTKSGPDGKRRHGERVELWDDGRRLDWLARKGAAGGFEVVTVQVNGVKTHPAIRVNPDGKTRGNKSGRPDGPTRLTFGGVVFEGLLKVTDAAEFRKTLAAGIGPGKAYGFGLLSIAPAR
jgi:CRISPR system Cascade subunit CasE